MKLPVLSVADGAAWEERLVAALARGSHGVEIVRRCVDVVDLLAVAASGQGRAALLAARCAASTPTPSTGCVAAAVVPVGRRAARRRRRRGPAARDRASSTCLPDDAEPDVAASVLAEAVRAATPSAGRTPAASRRALRTFADPSTSMAIPPGEGHPSPVAEPARRGSVVAVWGPTGAPGRTTVAVTLADELARLGAAALLIDADVYGGTVAAGPRSARRVTRAGRGVPAGAASSGWTPPRSPRCAGSSAPSCGCSPASHSPSAGPSCARRAVASVLAAARALADFTVVDCGFCLETDEELSFDTLAPAAQRRDARGARRRRPGPCRRLGRPDRDATPRARARPSCATPRSRAPVWVVLNRVRPGAVPGDTEAELRAALERFAGRTPAALLPADARALDAALATGRLLSEASPGSPLRQAVVELAGGAGGRCRAGHRRRRASVSCRTVASQLGGARAVCDNCRRGTVLRVEG